MASYIPTSNYSDDKVDFTFPREVREDLIDLEECERSSRMKERIDPVLLGKMFRVQEDLMHSRFGYRGRVMAKLGSSVDQLRGSAQNAVQESNRDISQWFDKAAEVVESGLAKLGVGKAGSSFLEEKERSRRMNEKIDPMVEARKHQVEDQLLQQIKPVA